MTDHPPADSFRRTAIEIDQISILVYTCWRIDRPDRIVCQWQDPDKVKAVALHALEGKAVTGVACTFPAADLALTFEDETILRVICALEAAGKEYGDYTLRRRNTVHSVGPWGKIEISVPLDDEPEP